MIWLMAQQASAAAEQQRIGQIVLGSLTEAKALEDAGQLDEAMSALGRGLAVSPDDAEVQAAMERLRTEAGRRQAALEVEARVARLRREGETLLQAGRYGEASSAFRQALSLGPSDEIEALLTEVQTGLRAELRRGQETRRDSALKKILA